VPPLDALRQQLTRTLDADGRVRDEASPALARARRGVLEGERVSIESRWGRTAARARITDRVAPGTVFLTFHFPDTHCNVLTGPQRDPESNCPEYKVTAVRIRPAGAVAR